MQAKNVEGIAIIFEVNNDLFAPTTIPELAGNQRSFADAQQAIAAYAENQHKALAGNGTRRNFIILEGYQVLTDK